MADTKVITAPDLRTQLLLILCQDHGHIRRSGALICRTCNRRVDRLLPVITNAMANSHIDGWRAGYAAAVDFIAAGDETPEPTVATLTHPAGNGRVSHAKAGA